MEYNFNAVFMIIIDEPIDIFDLFKRSDDTIKNIFKLQAPVVPVISNTTFSFTPISNNFIVNKIINNNDLIIFNLNYGHIIRGIFQVKIGINNSNIIDSNKTLEELKEFVSKLNYKNIFAYEISISSVINYNRYPLFKDKFKDVKNLKAFKTPKLRSIKIIDDNSDETDLREQYISEIDIEQNVIDPKKSNLNAVYRIKNFESSILNNILNDIDIIVNLIR